MLHSQTIGFWSSNVKIRELPPLANAIDEMTESGRLIPEKDVKIIKHKCRNLPANVIHSKEDLKTSHDILIDGKGKSKDIYALGPVIGSGGFGEVIIIQDIKTGKCKVLKKQFVRLEDNEENISPRSVKLNLNLLDDRSNDVSFLDGNISPRPNRHSVLIEKPLAGESLETIAEAPEDQPEIDYPETAEYDEEYSEEISERSSISLKEALNEQRILADFGNAHDKIIFHRTISREDPQHLLPMPYYPGLSATDIIEKEYFDKYNYIIEPILTTFGRLQIATSICEQAAKLISKGYIHRDLKSDNIIISPLLEATIIDFGSVRKADKGEYFSENIFGSRHYLAPEQKQQIIDRLPVIANEKTDVYAIGITLAELFFLIDFDKLDQYTNFPQTSHINLCPIMYERDERLEKNPVYRNMPAMLSLIQKMTDPDPKCRPTFNQAIEELKKIKKICKATGEQKLNIAVIDLVDFKDENIRALFDSLPNRIDSLVLMNSGPKLSIKAIMRIKQDLEMHPAVCLIKHKIWEGKKKEEILKALHIRFKDNRYNICVANLLASPRPKA